MMANPPADGSPPRSEPEIIPPDRTRGEQRRGASRIFVSIEDGGQQHIHVARLGPFAAILLALLFGVIGIVLAVLFVGTVLIIVPAIILIVFALIAVGILRNRFGRRGPV